jgi:ketosteroid isomerase-like protein
MHNDTLDQVRDLGRRWAEAQQRRDADALGSLLTDDFKLVGPLGFALDKQQWLAKYRSGALVTRSVEWDEVDVRDYGQTAIAIGRASQQAEYQGHPADGRFRVTQVAVRLDDRWALAGLHFSPIAEPPAKEMSNE